VLCADCGAVLGYQAKGGGVEPVVSVEDIAWAERAAILEYAGGLSRSAAEQEAWGMYGTTHMKGVV
jgi:hypothetical protein